MELLITEYQHPNRHVKYRMSGLLQNGRLIEAHFRSKESPSVLGNIYIGRVQNIAGNLNVAFVEFQPGKNGYLPLEHCENACFIKRKRSGHLTQGDEIIVQVEKENLKTKLPTLSVNLNFSGCYCVITSANHRIGISRKITGNRKKELLALFERETFDCCGLILRTNAEGAENAEILAEYTRLREEFEQFLHDAAFRTCYSCLRKSGADYETVLRNVNYSQLSKITTDDPEIYNAVSSFVETQEQLRMLPVRLWQDEKYSLCALHNIEKQIERALAKRVWLPSGAYLVIEPTEALTVIDVNTGKSTGKKNPQEHFLSVNLEAAREIAVQLRLRNLSGIVLIDFIDLKDQEAKTELMKYLKSEVKKDSVPVQVIDYTRLDLLELTRKKVSKSLAEQLT